MKDKKPGVLLLLTLCCLQLFLILFARRGVFLSPYDREYWKDRYEHSQYQLPLSQRIIGDDGLYAYAGYRLIKGDDPFSINVDKPPAGKYLIGLSILIFNNPAFSGLIFGVGSIILSFLIAKRLLKYTSAALFVALLLLLDPLVTSQMWTSLYDIIQLFFLLLNIFLLIQLGEPLKEKLKNRDFLIVFAAGISLGIFAEVKPPLILPFLFVIEGIYLIRRFGKLVSVIFVAGLTLGIFMPYFRYVQLHSVFDLLRIHKYMASFYLQSKLIVHFGAIWQVIFLGKFPHITSGQPIAVTEWWLMWPVAVFGSLVASLWLIFKKKFDFFWRLLVFVISFSLVYYTFIPAYSRYLVLVIPFIYLVMTKLLFNFGVKARRLFLSLAIFYGMINSIFFVFPGIDDALGVFYYSLSKGYFLDVYQENIAHTGNLKISREDFRFLAQSAMQQAEIEAIEIKELERKVPRWGKEGEIKAYLTYKTRNLGEFYEEKTVKLTKKNGQWKVIWDWNILLDGFRPGYSIITNISPGKRGSIISAEGVILAEDAPGYLVSVNPEKIDSGREQDMLEAISSISFQSRIGLQNAYLENVLPNSFAPLATNFAPLTKKEKQLLESYPGVKLELYPARLYYGLNPQSAENTSYKECCTRIYSATNYHGGKEQEKEYDQLLSGWNGGEAVLLNEKGEKIRIIIQSDKKNGQNITL